MNDEQAGLIILALKDIRNAMYECADKIVAAIDDIPGTHTNRIEKILATMVDAIDDVAGRINYASD